MAEGQKRYMRESIPEDLRTRNHLAKTTQRNDISVIYGDVVNERPQSFKDAIKDFVDITSRLSKRF